MILMIVLCVCVCVYNYSCQRNYKRFAGDAESKVNNSIDGDLHLLLQPTIVHFLLLATYLNEDATQGGK